MVWIFSPIRMNICLVKTPIFDDRDACMCLCLCMYVQ